jgi:hypothetical protein
MSLPTWLPDWLTPALELGRTQQFGLAFLLGSFAVATLSDPSGEKTIKPMDDPAFSRGWLYFLCHDPTSQNTYSVKVPVTNHLLSGLKVAHAALCSRSPRSKL